MRMELIPKSILTRSVRCCYTHIYGDLFANHYNCFIIKEYFEHYNWFSFNLVWFGFIAPHLLKIINAKYIFYWLTVLFQTIKFSISTQFSSIWPMNRKLSGINTPGQSGPGSNRHEMTLRILQRSGITRTSTSDSYPGHMSVGVLPPSREADGIFGRSIQLGRQYNSTQANDYYKKK